MALFEDHINQAKKNLVFLSNTNSSITDSYDWQVTACFYVALHLVNAHLAKTGMHYRSHTDVNNALNPYHLTSITKLGEEEYTSYIKLSQLSRRSRYLVKDSDKPEEVEKAFFTYDKHLAKAIRHLDKLTAHFTKRYGFQMPNVNLTCPGLKREELKSLI